jgi:hypothetical protein
MKMDLLVLVTELLAGDVISTKSSSEWEWGATVGEAQRDDDGMVSISDRNGHPLGGGRWFYATEKVWVEREVKVEGHGYLLLGVMQDYAPNTEAQKIAAAHLKKMQSGGATEKEIDLAMAGALLDGLRHGNWPWV